LGVTLPLIRVLELTRFSEMLSTGFSSLTGTLPF
jgi:hypothetical protein